MIECKPSPSPSPIKPTHLNPDPDVTLFRTLVGSLQYLTLTRPEISYPVNQEYQHMHTPHLSHFLAIKRILRYIKGTLHYGFHFTPCPLSLVAFSDANWTGDQLNRRSTTGYGGFLGSN